MSATDARTEVRHWWGQRWLDALDATGAGAARAVRRGHGLARRGTVQDLALTAGSITASASDDRGTRARVELVWPEPDDAAWTRAIEALSGQLRYTAALLDGALPEELAEDIEAAGVDLVPDLTVLTVRCSCEERGPICRHVAAVVVAAAVQVDRDPGLLFELRGRSRDELLHRARQGSASPEQPDLDLTVGLEVARGDLEAIELHPAPSDDPAALLRHLGPPPGVDDPEPLEALVERAAETAWRLAAGAGSQAADQELLLTELRAQRTASADSIASALGRDVDEVRDALDRLFEAGEVLRTGSGERARYRAAAS